MHQKLVPRLQQTYDTLHAKSTLALETEAIVSALIEELEDVNDAVEGARHPAMSPESEAHEDEEILEAQIVELLKGLLSMSRHIPFTHRFADAQVYRLRDGQAHCPPQSFGRRG